MKRVKKKQEIESLKKLPIDVSAFDIMIEKNYLYIDKTEIIHDLITEGRFYFLSRLVDLVNRYFFLPCKKYLREIKSFLKIFGLAKKTDTIGLYIPLFILISQISI